MIERQIKQKILNALKNFRVVIISGPRQAGKTSLVKHIAEELNLDLIETKVSVEESISVIPEVIRILNSFDPGIPNDVYIC